MLQIVNLSNQNVDLGGGVSLAPGGVDNTRIAITPAMTTAQAAGLISISGSEGAAAVTQGVTQLTSIATGVTLNSVRGAVTTFAASAAAGVSQTFTVTNSLAGIGSNIRAYIINYAGAFGTNGNPVVNVDNRAAGAFDIVITNTHAANALSGALVIGFEIVS